MLNFSISIYDPILVRKSSKLDSDLLGCKSWQRLEELIDSENSTFNISHVAKAMFITKELYQHTIEAKRIFEEKLVPLFKRLYTHSTSSLVPYEKIITSLAHITDASHSLIPLVISILKRNDDNSFHKPVDVFWALAKLNQKDNVLIKNILHDLRFLVKSMNGEDLSKVAWSLIKLDLANQNAKLVSAMDKRVKSLSKQLLPQNRCIILRLFSRSENSHHLSSINLLLSDCLNNLANFDNKHLYMLLNVIDTLGIQKVQEKFCIELLMLGIRKFDTMSLKHLSYFADFASTVANLDVAARFLLKIKEYFLKNHKEFKSNDLYRITYAFSIPSRLLRFENPTLFMSALIAEKESDFTATELFRQYSNLATTGPVDENLLKALLEKLSKNSVDLDTKLLSSSILSLVKDLSQEKYLPPITNLVKILIKRNLTIRMKQEIVISVNTLLYVYKQVFDQEIMDKIKLYTTEIEGAEKPISSSLHLTVSSSLNRLQFEHKNEVFIHGYWVDILLLNNVILEVNGPIHYNNYRKNRNSKMKRRLLRALGYNIYYINYKKIDDFSDPKITDAHIQKVLDTHQKITSFGSNSKPQKRKSELPGF